VYLNKKKNSRLAFSDDSLDKVAFSPKEWRSFELKQIRELTHNTCLFRYALPSPEHEMGMKTASCIMVQGVSQSGEVLARPYTPTTTNDQRGFFDLIVKKYPNGNVSSYIHNMKIGEHLRVKGPFIKLEYVPNMFRKIGMVAGGSGITPMLQICQEVLNNPDDVTELSLIFANNSEEDIMQKAWIDEMQAKFPNFKVYYVVLESSSSWDQGKGYITQEMMKANLPPPEEGTMIFVCGPPAMMEVVSGDKPPGGRSQGDLQGFLKLMGFSENQVFKF